jgi:hypothetical protein
VSEIASKDAKPEQAAEAGPTSDCRVGEEPDSPAGHHELEIPPVNTQIDGAAIEKSHSPSPQPCNVNDPTTNADPIWFLDIFFGEKPWPLVAIRKTPNHVQAGTFVAAPDRNRRARDWVMSFNGRGYDVYFAVNPLKQPMSKKAGKADVASARWLWVDLDPLKDAELDAERQEMLALLTDRRPEGLPEPTWIIDSGRGYWGFWGLKETQPVDGQGPQTKNVESYGRGIEKAFPGRADHCRDIDRIARLPGTVNQKTGQRAWVIAHRPDRVYELTDFPRVEAPATGGGKAANSSSFSRDSTSYRPGRADVDKLPVSDTIKAVIRTGENPHNPKRYESRSETVLAVLVALAGAGCDDVTMSEVMLDPGLPIGAHIQENSDPSKYLGKQIRKARDHLNTLPRQPPPGSRAGPRNGRRADVNFNQDRLLLNMQRAELRILYRIRRINVPLESWASEADIDLGHLYDPVALGALLEFTVEEDERFATDPMGRAAPRFPKRLKPAEFTKSLSGNITRDCKVFGA